MVVLYCALVLLLMTPWAQTHVVYAHRFDISGAKPSGFVHPEDYGLAPGKTINLRLRAPDGTSLGAWFILSEPVYRSLPFPPEHKGGDDALIRRAVSESPTLLFLHGNSGTRALPLRTAIYTSLTSRLSANILALDYRGFGDSEGQPTVPGVAMDARTAWDWLTLQMGAKVKDIVIVGHSLGTAIAGLLSAQLGREGVNVHGVVLLAPFSSVKLLMDQYAILGVPLLKPLAKLPFVPRLLAESITHNFDILSQIPDITAPVFIAHGLDDFDIPHMHADILFNAFIEPYLPSSIDAPTHSTVLLPPDTNSTRLHVDWDTLTAAQAARAIHRERIIERTEVPHFGVLQEFEVSKVATNGDAVGRRIVLLKTQYGGHDVGRVEGVQDVVGRMFKLRP
ncbi:hypothetical protein C0995_012694 [Termitomyces sp. Mi166|nr:hypothetical protein C0995_012694 [Termitomyces sp. Mi166\